MENPIYISLSRMTALRRQMDVVANNVANVNTTGYKQQQMLFTEYLKKPALGERLSMVQDRGTVRDTSVGALTPTTNPLDVAISGKGYFVVDTVNGPHYSRAGRFQLDAQRQIVDESGLPVMDQNNRAITLPQAATSIRIDPDGSVITNVNPSQPVGKLKVVTFTKEQAMMPVGGGLYTTSETPQAAPAETKLQQGALEESNVKPVLEMTNMIEILRQYQSMQKVVDAEQERQRTMIQRLGRASA
jgi:flagellar basal-body rod protein FlgF